MPRIGKSIKKESKPVGAGSNVDSILVQVGISEGDVNVLEVVMVTTALLRIPSTTNCTI